MFEVGKTLPSKIGEFPPSLYGKPIEDLDDYYRNKYTFMIVAKDKTIFRFSATKGFFIFTPFNPIRRAAMYVLTHPYPFLTVMVVILVNCVFMAIKEEFQAAEKTFTGIYTVEGSVKMLARGFILADFTYLRDAWNWLDFIVVMLAYVTMGIEMGNVAVLRTFRVLRALKTVAVVPGLKTIVGALMEAVRRLRDVMILSVFVLSIFALVGLQLYQGHISRSIKNLTAINVTTALYTLYLFFFRTGSNRRAVPSCCVACTETNQGDCPVNYTCAKGGDNPDFNYTNFDNFGWAMLCAFRLMTQDYWENLYQQVIRTNGPNQVLFFVIVIFLGSFYLVNVILAIVAMSYDDCRKQDQIDADLEEEAEMKAEEAFFEVKYTPSVGSANSLMLANPRYSNGGNGRPVACDKMSVQSEYCCSHNCNQEIYKQKEKSVSRLVLKFEDPTKNKLAIMDNPFICRTPSTATIDLQDVLVLKDLIRNASNKRRCYWLGYEPGMKKKEFLKEKCMQLLFGWECHPLWYKVAHITELFIMDAFVDLFITLCIVVNTVFMAMEHANMHDTLVKVLSYGNYVFTGIFTVEAALKILALGLYKYLQDKWSCFDFVIVILSLVEMGLEKVKGLSILRSFRLLRVFKLAKSWPTLNLLIGIIGRTMGALGNLCFVLAIIIFIFAVMGMQLFGAYYTDDKFPFEVGENRELRWHFKDFFHSFMIVFRILCGEWIENMWNCLRTYGKPCIPFFLLTMIVGNLVVLNLFLALLLSSFGAESLKHSQEEEGPNKLQEAVDRINRFAIYIKSHITYCVKVKVRHKQIANDYFFDERTNYIGQHDANRHGNNNMCVNNNDSSSNTNNNINDNNSNRGVVIVNATPIGNGRIVNAEGDYELNNDDDDLSRAYNKSNHSKRSSVNNNNNNNNNDVPRTTGGPEINEVKVVFVKYPDDCCPRLCMEKCSFWDLLENTLFGKVYWKFRCYMFSLVENNYFETFIILMILASSLALAIEDKNIDTKPLLKHVLKVMDSVFTVIFVFEMIVKMAAYGLKKYFTDAWCWLDFIIVAISLVGWFAEGAGAGNMGAFRALRTLRALRPLRAVSRWEGMKVVVNALIQAIPAIFNVLLVCLVFWLIFSIMGVNLFMGRFGRCLDEEGEMIKIVFESGHYVIQGTNDTLTRELCKKNFSVTRNYTWFNPKVNFDNVLIGYLSLFQIATFKGWMDIMYAAIDSREPTEQPLFEDRVGVYLYFVLFIVFGAFFTLNLFIGVIIENFNMQKKKAGGSMEMLMTEDQKKYYNAMKKLGSKQPTKPIPKPKLTCQLFFFNLTKNQKFDVAIMVVILLNMTTMGLEHYDQPKAMEITLNYINTVFIVIFTLECVMKLLGLRFYYFKEPWNIFDFVVVITSILAMALSSVLNKLPVSPTMLRVVRVFRVGRVLRLVKSAKGIRTLLFSLAVSMPALFNIGLLLFLVMFIYAIVGMSSFMHVKHSAGIDDMFNFETFFNSMIILFQICTSAGWDGVLAGLMNDTPPDCDDKPTESSPNGDCGNSALGMMFLVTYLVITFLVIINMYIAVILENFSQATEDVQQGLTQDDFDMYYELWERFDENATQYIPLDRLCEFVDTLEDPLRLPAPNLYKLVSMDIPICENDMVHCIDILDALTKNFLGTANEDTGELGDLKGPEKKDYHPISTTLKRQREMCVARIIQKSWRNYVNKKRLEHAKEDLYQLDKVSLESYNSRFTSGSKLSILEANSSNGVNVIKTELTTDMDENVRNIFSDTSSGSGSVSSYNGRKTKQEKSDEDNKKLLISFSTVSDSDS
ncbi:hypothetical protein HELRODRAFT_109965 [Helobdella robusta]|uniref:Sodium channel protein n=1 Tax=Helobdella robusta TaxID=6412 RepID=T1EEX7_HELRO|nr:hypothetical protein HELRODRAFT_109965 [Helobdella robusta]ESO08974.1 hypothetical protein HELRODRAFT_109965 [Helobdella robusta]